MNPSDLLLTRAVSDGDTTAVRDLLTAGSDVNTAIGGQTPLILAIAFRHVEIAKLLLEAGADPELKDSLGLNAIAWAKKTGLAEGLGLTANDQPENSGARSDTPGSDVGIYEKPPAPRNENQNVTVSKELQERETSYKKSQQWIKGLKQRFDEEKSVKAKEPELPPVRPSETENKTRKEAPYVGVNGSQPRASLALSEPEVNKHPSDCATSVPNDARYKDQTYSDEATIASPAQDLPVRPSETENKTRKEAPYVGVNGSQPGASLALSEPEVNKHPSDCATSVPNDARCKDQTYSDEATIARPAQDLAQPQLESSNSTLSSRKRCPKCNTLYDSVLLAYCAIDMTALVDADSVPVMPSPHTSNKGFVWFLLVLTFMAAAGITYIMVPSWINKQSAAPEKSPIQAPNINDSPLVSGDLSGKQVNVPAPEYPVSARSVHVSGTVTVRVTVNKQGTVTSATVIEGDKRLRRAAISAAQKAIFSPEKLQGREAVGTIAYSFHE